MEVCILLIVLAIIGSVAAPRIGKASSEARLSRLVESLQDIRSNIALYKIQNNNLLPGQTEPGGDISQEAFIAAITGINADGSTAYLKKIPLNPFSSRDKAGMITCVNSPLAVPKGNEDTGWWLNAATGQFRACDSAFHAAY